MTSREDFDRIWQTEKANEYPAIAAFEAESAFALDREWLEDAARTLACPFKANPPNWQHGRVLYAALRRYLVKVAEPILVLDIGTAKGFSALCAAKALDDHGVQGAVVSVDVLDPQQRVARNSVADCDGVKTVPELVEQWPVSAKIQFLKSTGVAWLSANPQRVHFAFVDGKHSYEAVSREAQLLGERQQPGDVIVFDDLQYPGIEKAVDEITGYRVDYIDAKRDRRYAVATRL